MQQPFDFGKLFGVWGVSSSPAVAASPSVSLHGRLLSVQTKNGLTRYRVCVDSDAAGGVDPIVSRALSHDGTLSVSVPAAQHVVSGVQALDKVLVRGCHEKTISDGRVFLNATGCERLAMWSDDEQRALLASEHVPLPLPAEGKGVPFTLYSGTTALQSVPGLHRIATPAHWTEFTWTKDGVDVRRLSITLVQRQWSTADEVQSDPEPLVLRLLLWDDVCQQLPGGGLTTDMTVWKAVMAVHFVPFYAACCVDVRFSTPGIIALSALAVQWDLARYLESDAGLAVPLDAMRSFFPASAASKAKKSVVAVAYRAGDVVNVSQLGALPAGCEAWRFYALTSDPKHVTDVTALRECFPARCSAVFLAIVVQATAPVVVAVRTGTQPPTKRQK